MRNLFKFKLRATVFISRNYGTFRKLFWDQGDCETSQAVERLASDIIFFPTAIPGPYDRWLALNPLLQCVEWIRYAYYEDYPDKLLNIPYLITFATACLAVSLIAERLARRVLLSN
jgi:hypothetical protein